MTRYKAFISCSSAYQEWATVLKDNLEHPDCLGPGSIWLDRDAIEPGHSWWTSLQTGLVQSEQILLLASPEAFASPWVDKEVQSADLNGKLQVLHVADTPFPSFLRARQHIDFRPDPDRSYREVYESGLKKLADLLQATGVPQELVVPESLPPQLPRPLRKEIVERIAKELGRHTDWLALISKAELQPANILEKLGDPELRANAALVRIQGDDTPSGASDRLLQICESVFAQDDSSGQLKNELRALRKKIKGQASKTGESLRARYLEWVRNTYKDLTAPFLGDLPGGQVETVYVELGVKSREQALGRDREARFADPSARALRTLDDWLSLPPESEQGITGRWVLKGKPGSGKTTLLRRMAWCLALKALEEDEAPLPIPAYLPSLVQHGWRGHLAHLEERLLSIGGKGLEALVEQAAGEGRLIVLLDGLDEVPEHQRDAALRLVKDLGLRFGGARPGASRLLVASRVFGYRSPGGEFLELEIQPLEREEKIDLLAGWLRDPGTEKDLPRATEELDQLEKDASLAELTEVPFFLAQMGRLRRKKIAPEVRRSAFFKQIVDLLLSGEHRPDLRIHNQLPKQDSVRRALECLAFELVRQGKARADFVPLIESRAMQAAWNRLESAHEPWKGEPTSFLKDVAKYSGIIGPCAPDEPEWEFQHRSLLESLAAVRLQTVLQERSLDEFLAELDGQGGGLDHWAEPLALYAASLPQPDAFLLEVVDKQPHLALLVAATVPNLEPDTLARVLELPQGRGDWEERAEIYQRIPRQVQQPERVIALIRKLVAQTRNGNDLYFLDQALEGLGADYEELRSQITHARKHLFAHIEEAQRQEILNTGLPQWANGGQEMWIELPAGSFHMGEQRQSRLVTLTEPFRILAIPVTNRMFRCFDPQHEPYPWTGVSPESLDDHPIVSVTWHEAKMFARWLGGDLPTEAQWEYACRGGDIRDPWISGKTSTQLGRFAWFDINANGRTHRVARREPNRVGLFDMAGNVWEWCQDWGGAFDSVEECLLDPSGPESGSLRVIRGGSFGYDAGGLRSACRFGRLPGDRGRNLGFRVVLPAARQ